MPLARVQGVRVSGVASAVPALAQSLVEGASAFSQEELRRIAERTGIERRHLSPGKLCTSDLCHHAGARLLGLIGWEPRSVEGLVFVSQTFDFPAIPATACTLQARLGLANTCAAFDVALGCSGYVYGLWIAASLMAGSGLNRVLVLAGDVINRACSPLDRSTALLFGDAGSATALEKATNTSGMLFSLGMDGTGWNNLVIPAGAYRHPRSQDSSVRKPAEGNNQRSAEDLFMNGAEVFGFSLREVPPLVQSLIEGAGWNSEQVDYFVFHQANKFMLQHLAKFMKVPPGKVPLSLGEYGNTSSASIPVTISAKLGEAARSGTLRLLLAGFGVGYSWGGCCLECGPMAAPEVFLVEESEGWLC